MNRMDCIQAERFGAYFWNLARDRLKCRPAGQGTIGNVIGYRKPALHLEVFVNTVPVARRTPPPSPS